MEARSRPVHSILQYFFYAPNAAKYRYITLYLPAVKLGLEMRYTGPLCARVS